MAKLPNSIWILIQSEADVLDWDRYHNDCFLLTLLLKPAKIVDEKRDKLLVLLLFETGGESEELSSKSYGNEFGSFICGYVRGVVDFHSNAIPVTRNEWVHVAGVHDGSELRLYVNGELAATTPAVGDIPEGSEALTIGDAIGDQWLHDRPFIGLIDEVRIYNRVLSADEIGEAMEPIELAVQPSGKTTTFWAEIKSN